MPVLESGEELLVGGQAVIEGVMMRAPHSYCVAVRRPDGSIAACQAPIQRPSEKHKFFKYPLLRGLGTLGQAMGLGIKALRFSADVAVEAEAAKAGRKTKPLSPVMIALNVAFSIGFFIFLYKFLPLVFVTEMQTRWPALENLVVFNLADGLVRMAIFLVFLAVISRLRDIHRVFEYHGAEHKVVFNFESGQAVDVEHARVFPTLHPRCGTSFLLVVMTISMLLYAFIPVTSFGAKFAVRIILLPVIAGLSYEVIRFAARRQSTLWASMVRPGLWLQKITTQPPSDDQLAISIHALEGAMALEKEQNGELVIA
jgi:uncharacterized protein YqhQ